MTYRSTSSLLTAFALVMALPMFGADTYKIDPAHSETGFHIRHMLSKVAGRFTAFQGTIVVDADAKKSSVDVTIDTASINTGNEARDKHLATPDFFDVKNFPTITFKSTAVTEVSKGNLEVTGNLTMHGVTKTVVIQAKNLGTMPGMKAGSVVAGFEGSLKLNRSDYGIKYGIPAVGDEVEITLNVEAGKVEPKA